MLFPQEHHLPPAASVRPSTAPTLLPAAAAVSPRPPSASGSQNNLTAPPPGGGSGGPSPVPPSPGESPLSSPPSARCPAALREPAVLPPRSRYGAADRRDGGSPAAGGRLLRRSSPRLGDARLQPAATASQAFPSLPNSRGGGPSRLGAPGASLSQGVAPGHRWQGCSHLRSSAPRPQPLRRQAHLRPVTEPAAGASAWGKEGMALSRGSRACAYICWDRKPLSDRNTLSVATTVQFGEVSELRRGTC